MAEEIKRIITVDTKNSDKSIRDLKNEIKSLQKELEQTAVGSDEFNSALKRLTQTQRSYNEIQQQVRSMSKTNQQNMVNMARFASNLGKAYSSLNAAIGLFADGNEDVQKTMLKVQRSIQLIQGLDGIVGIIRDLPNLVKGFRDWFSSLSPIERSVDRIARGINGIDPKKLNGINGAGGASASASASSAGGRGASAAGDGGTRINIEAENKAIERQTQILAANGKALEDAGGQYLKLDRMLQKYDDTLEEVGLHLQDDIDLKEESIKVTEEQVGTENEVYKKQKAELDGLYAKRTQLTESLNQQEAAIKDEIKTIELSTTTRREAINIIQQQRDSIQNLYEDLAKRGQGDSTRAIAYKRELDLLNEQEKSLKLSTRAAKGLGNTLKQAFNFIWINAWVIAIVAAGAALLKYIKNVNAAAKEQRALNKAVSEGTNQIASKQIVVLKELAVGYKNVGESAEAKTKFLEDFKDKIKQTGIEITGVNKADDVFINNTSKYIDALMKRARAQAAENVAVKEYEKFLNKLYDIDTKIADTEEKRANTSQTIGRSVKTGMADIDAAYEELGEVLVGQTSLLDKKLRELQEQRTKLFEDTNNKIRKIYAGIPDAYDELLDGTNKADDDAAKAAEEAAKAAAEAKARAEELRDTMRQDLETLKKANEDALRVLMDERTRELQDVAKHYDELIELAKKYNQDTTLLEIARQREIQDIIDKYEKERRDKEYSDIQEKIERTRMMYATSNLREPTEQRYQTRKEVTWLEGLFFDDAFLRKIGIPGFATGKNWINVYQSKEDVEKQLEEQIKYNNQFYELTKKRIEEENILLNQQLKIEGLSADQRLEIQRTLTENMIALSDAQLQNEQANLQAYLDAQEKRRQALNGILDVTSTLTGAIAQMARMEAENAEEGSKKQKAATVAYKAFAITQAIVDTYKGANEAYTAMASIPYVGPVLGAIAAGAAIASGIANVMAIKREDISGSTNVSSQASVSAPSALNTPPIEYTRNLIGDKELDEMNQPIKCYVLEQDITDKQNKVKVTEQNASF